jgi:hypothetical protein
MRRTIITLSALLGLAVLAAPAIASGYCEGYQVGYKAGFCEGKPVCYAGYPNGCPGSNSTPNDYQAGYARGYSDGRAAARRSS